MSKKKEKFYVVWKGKRPGIYTSWDDCKAMIAGYKGAQYKSFKTFEEAKKRTTAIMKILKERKTLQVV